MMITLILVSNKTLIEIHLRFIHQPRRQSRCVLSSSRSLSRSCCCCCCSSDQVKLLLNLFCRFRSRRQLTGTRKKRNRRCSTRYVVIVCKEHQHLDQPVEVKTAVDRQDRRTVRLTEEKKLLKLTSPDELVGLQGLRGAGRSSSVNQWAGVTSSLPSDMVWMVYSSQYTGHAFTYVY